MTTHRITAPLYFKTSTMFAAKPKFILWILSFAVMLSGLGVIYMSDANRHMIMHFEDVNAHTSFLETEWDKLLLERSTWSSQSRIQQIALTSFGMVEPGYQQVMTIKLES